MKRTFVIVAIFVVGALVWAGNFYYENLRGIAPAMNPPVGDIAQRISGNSAKDAENKTGLPLTIPRGFSVSIFAKNLGNPRVLAWDQKGALLVSIPSKGQVVALVDSDQDGISDKTMTVASGLRSPHGLVFLGNSLYIAQTDRVTMFDYDANEKKATNARDIIELPGGGNHFSRTIGFGPDGRLYIAVGSSCNVCIERDWRRAKILVANADGSGLKEYASGLRNSVFFVWHPVTKTLWATDMGRDLLGDNTPPEEVNIIVEGRDYGWPYCYSNRVHDDAFDPKKRKSCDSTAAPHITFQAHSAPLGLAFIPESWPEEYRGDLLVSYHGSWNRTVPTGYKVVRFDLDEAYVSRGESDFLSGFLEGKGALGRPVDLLFDPKGNLFISDDKAGIIYRIIQR